MKYLPADVAFSLDELKRAELVRALQEAEYIFKHALVQDTVYHSLLKHERKRLHRAIGSTLEELYASHADEYSAELALHFDAAGEDAQTSIYAARAGDRAAGVFAYPEAHAYFQQSLAALERLPDTVEHRRARVDLTVKLVGVSLRERGPEWCLARLRPAEELLSGLHAPEDRMRRARVHFWMGDAYSHLNQQREAIAYLQQVLDAEQEGIDDESVLAIPANVIGRALVAQGKFNQAQPLLARAAPLLEKSANWYEWVLAVGFLGFALAAQGEIQAGLHETARAITRAEELGTPFGVADSHIFTSFIFGQQDDTDKMLYHAELALQAAERVRDQLLIYIAQNVVAWAHTRLGDFTQAEAEFARATEIAARMGGQLFFADLFQAAYAELALRQGDFALAITRAEQAVATAREAGAIYSEGLAQRIWALALAPTNQVLAQEHLTQSITLFKAGNARTDAASSRALQQDLKLMHHSDSLA